MADFVANFTLNEQNPIGVNFILSEPDNITATFTANFKPSKMSELANDADYVQDADYVHTDNNFTDEEKENLSNQSGVNTGDQDLTPYALLEEVYTQEQADSLFEPLLPETPVNPETKYLGLLADGTKTWKDIAIGAGGFAGNLYFTALDSDVTGYKKIEYEPEATETELTGTISNEEVLLRTYLYDNGIDTTIIDGGLWVANYRVKVNKTSGTSQLKLEAFVRHINGTETTLFSDYSPDLNNTEYLTIRSESTQPSFNVSETDRLGVRIYAKATSMNVKFNTIVGDGNGGYFTTPLRIRHNQLRDLNGDNNYLHVTDTEKSTWNAKQAALGFTPENLANKDEANGYCSLDLNKKVPLDNIPDSILGQLEYQGPWNAASGNYPTATEKGQYWIATSDGTVSGVDYKIGDWTVFNGATFDKIDNTDAVASVNGRTGTITGLAEDSTVVHNSGNETVAGVKNFTDNQTGANISQLNQGTCDTAQATTLKEVTLAGYVPKQGDTIKVLMANASVASASLRVNGGTTYVIRVASGATTTSSWASNSICEFKLDGTYAFLISIKVADSTTQPTFYGNASSATSSTSATSATYSTGGIISVNTLSDTNDNTNKWAYFGYFTLTYNSTYNRGMSINHCFLFNEYSRVNSDVSVNDLEAFQVQVKVNLKEVTSSSLFNSAVPNIAINITGKTNLTSSDFCALVYSTSTSAKVIRLYVKLKTPNKHYGFLPICYGNNAYSSTGAISTSYISWTSASVQALISDLPTPAQGTVIYPTFSMTFNSVGSAIFSGDILANNLPKEWLELSLSSDYDATSMSRDDIIPFDQVAGNMAYDSEGRAITLTEGKHYDIYISVQHTAKEAGSTLLVTLLDINSGSPVMSVSNTRCYAYSERVMSRSNGNAVYRVKTEGRPVVCKLVVNEIKDVQYITAERTLLYIREVQA